MDKLQCSLFGHGVELLEAGPAIKDRPEYGIKKGLIVVLGKCKRCNSYTSITSFGGVYFTNKKVKAKFK